MKKAGYPKKESKSACLRMNGPRRPDEQFDIGEEKREGPFNTFFLSLFLVDQETRNNRADPPKVSSTWTQQKISSFFYGLARILFFLFSNSLLIDHPSYETNAKQLKPSLRSKQIGNTCINFIRSILLAPQRQRTRLELKRTKRYSTRVYVESGYSGGLECIPQKRNTRLAFFLLTYFEQKVVVDQR